MMERFLYVDTCCVAYISIKGELEGLDCKSKVKEAEKKFYYADYYVCECA